MKWSVMLIVAVILGGCSRTEWRKPNVTLAQAGQDQKECNYEAVKATPPSQSRNEISAALEEVQRERKLLQMCMEARGYAMQVGPQ
jgi:hypothetical protein